MTLTFSPPNHQKPVRIKGEVIRSDQVSIDCKFTELGRKCEDAIQQTFNLAKHTLPIL
jgi:hypothetical protein